MAWRNQSLDVLRAVAVLLVLCHHYPVTPVFDSGWIGVDLFFVLSGFLISGLLFRELRDAGRIRVGRFFVRRGFKIYPAFFFFLALTAFLFPGDRPYLPTELLFLQSYRLVNTSVASEWAHLWSLAVEEHFYIALPLLLLLLNRARIMFLIPWLSLGLIFACAAFRTAYVMHTGSGVGQIYPTHLRADALFVGVVLGYLFAYKRETFSAISQSQWLIPGGLVLLSPALFSPSNAVAVSLIYTSNLLAFGLLLLWAVSRQFRGVGWLAEIGQYSYSIYLWQMVVAMFWHGHAQTWWRFVGYVATSVAVGIFMSLIIEQPFLTLRDLKLVRKEDAPFIIADSRVPRGLSSE